MTDEAKVNRSARITNTAQKIYLSLTEHHGPQEAVEVLAFVIAGLANLTTTVNKHSSHLGYDKNLEALLGYINQAAKNTKVVVIGLPKE